MKFTVVCVLVALAFSATLAAPATHQLSAEVTIQKKTVSAIANKYSLLSTIPEIIAQLEASLKAVQDALIEARAALAVLLAEDPLGDVLVALITDAESRAGDVLSDGLAQLGLASNLTEAIEIIEDTVTEVNSIIDTAVAQARELVAGTEFAAEVEHIIVELLSDIQAAVEALLAVLIPVAPSTVAPLGTPEEILEQLQLSLAEVSKAIADAQTALSALLAENGAALADQIAVVIKNAESEISVIVARASFGVAMSETLEEAHIIIAAAAANIQDEVNSALAEILRVVEDSGIPEDTVAQVQQILNELLSKVISAIEDLLALLPIDAATDAPAVVAKPLLRLRH